MGRTARPASLHKVLGNPSKLSAAALGATDSAPRIPFEVPDCPRHLDKEARQEWDRITPLLVTGGLLTQYDRAICAAYCQAWGEWVRWETRLKALLKGKEIDEVLIEATPSGYKQVAAMCLARDRAVDRMLRAAKEFGLTPASRIQQTTGQQLALPGVPDDPMESFLRAGENLPQNPVH